MRASWLLLLICGVAAAADDFEFATILVAQTYERQNTNFSIAGIGVGGTTTDMNRVVVVLDGYDVTGEFPSKTVRSPSAKELKVGSEIPAAIKRNKLLLKWPDGTVVEAQIVQKATHKVPGERQTRD